MFSTIQRQRLLAVEGKDDVNAFEAFRDKLEIPDLEIRSFDGEDNLRGFLKALPSVGGFESLLVLGIVRDAEDDPNAREMSIRDGLQAAGFAVPAAPLQLAPGKPAVAFLINPLGRKRGSLEDLCVASVAGTPRMTCVETYIECLKRAGEAPRREGKARVHAYIASRDRPEVSLGIAVKRGYFPLEHNAFVSVRQLLELLRSAQL